MDQPTHSAWVRRFAPLIRPGGRVLDLAAGAGRHTRLLLDMGFAVTAVDRDIEGLRPLVGDKCEIRAIDLETGAQESAFGALGGGYDGVVAANYLYRPLFAAIAAALAPDGVLIYETFAVGNERFGRPRNPDFLLHPGELIEAFAALTILAFEQGGVTLPRPSVIQRIAAVAGPLGRLPEAVDLDKEETRGLNYRHAEHRRKADVFGRVPRLGARAARPSRVRRVHRHRDDGSLDGARQDYSEHSLCIETGLTRHRLSASLKRCKSNCRRLGSLSGRCCHLSANGRQG